VITGALGVSVFGFELTMFRWISFIYLILIVLVISLALLSHGKTEKYTIVYYPYMAFFIMRWIKVILDAALGVEIPKGQKIYPLESLIMVDSDVTELSCWLRLDNNIGLGASM